MRSQPSVRWVLEDAERGGGVETVFRVLDAGLRSRGADSAVLSWLPAEQPAHSSGSVGWVWQRLVRAWHRDRLARNAASQLRERLTAEPNLVLVLEPGSFDVARRLAGRERWGIHVHRTPDLILRPWRHLAGERIPFGLRSVVRLRMRLVGSRQSRVLRTAPFLVSLTPSHTRALSGLQERIIEIPNPVECEPVVTRSPPEPDGAVTVGYLGRLAYEKGPDVLVEALAGLDASATGRVRVLFAGTGPLLDHVRAKAEALAPLDIGFLGWVGEPREFLDRVDVLVLPSRAEAVPLVLVEALAAGCRVVAADAGGGVRDVLQGGRLGAIVPVEDASAMADAIASAVVSVRQASDNRPDEIAALARRHSTASVTDTWLRTLAELADS